MKPPPVATTKGCASAVDWLRQEERFGLLLPSALSLCRLERDLRSLSAFPLLAACQVAGLSGGELKLLVPSPAHAAKLNQLAPAIVKELSARAWQVSSLRIRVQGRSSQGPASPNSYANPVKAATMTPRSLAALDALAGTLPASALRDAVLRFARRHQGR